LAGPATFLGFFAIRSGSRRPMMQSPIAAIALTNLALFFSAIGCGSADHESAAPRKAAGTASTPSQPRSHTRPSNARDKPRTHSQRKSAVHPESGGHTSKRQPGNPTADARACRGPKCHTGASRPPNQHPTRSACTRGGCGAAGQGPSTSGASRGPPCGSTSGNCGQGPSSRDQGSRRTTAGGCNPMKPKCGHVRQ